MKTNNKNLADDLAVKLFDLFEGYVGTNLQSLLEQREYIEMRLRLSLPPEEFEIVKATPDELWNRAFECFYAKFPTLKGCTHEVY